jgi:hypothetical protein
MKPKKRREIGRHIKGHKGHKTERGHGSDTLIASLQALLSIAKSAPTPPLVELTPVAQFQTSSSAVATIAFFQQLTAQVCFITFSIAQPQFRGGLQLEDELFRKEGRSVVDSFIGQQYNRAAI